METKEMMMGNQAPSARNVLVALRTYLRRDTELLVDAAHDLAIDARPAALRPLCRSCRPTWRTAIAEMLGGFVQDLVVRHERTIDRIDQALERLEDGAYGTCTMCRLPISPQWLAKFPYAERCAHCQTHWIGDRRVG